MFDDYRTKETVWFKHIEIRKGYNIYRFIFYPFRVLLIGILVCFITFENDVFNSLYYKVDVCVKPYCYCAGFGT